MLLVRTFVLICCLAISLLAQARVQDFAENGYAQVELQEFANRAAEYEGRRVAITADVFSVSADARTLNVFDARSKALVGVSLAQLSKSRRQTLINEPVTRVSVYGRVELKNGQAVIKADQVMPLLPSLVGGKGLVAQK